MADKSSVTQHVMEWARDARGDHDPHGKAAQHHRLQLLRWCWREFARLLRWRQKCLRNTARMVVWHACRRALTVLIALRRHREKGYVDALASGAHMGGRLWRREIPSIVELRKKQYEARRNDKIQVQTRSGAAASKGHGVADAHFSTPTTPDRHHRG
jgi:hypothetical protein